MVALTLGDKSVGPNEAQYTTKMLELINDDFSNQFYGGICHTQKNSTKLEIADTSQLETEWERTVNYM